jgi:hypothetical protein
MKRLLAGCALTLGLLGAGGTALADQVYHTEQIALAPVGGAPLRAGFVVNVHADGPQVFALERYALNGAAPGSYSVLLHVYADAACTTPLVTLQTATLTTNAEGNGLAAAVIRPEMVEGLHGATLGAVWELVSEQGTVYRTGCTTVTLD